MEAKALFLALNSAVFHLFKEILARPPEGGGGGPLQINIYQYEAILIPKPTLYKQIIPELPNLLRTVLIPSFWEEVGLTPPHFEGTPRPLPHRVALDRPVFEALGLSEEERHQIYRDTARLVWRRIRMARGAKEGRARHEFHHQRPRQDPSGPPEALLQHAQELKFLVGYFYFSGYSALYDALRKAF